MARPVFGSRENGRGWRAQVAVALTIAWLLAAGAMSQEAPVQQSGTPPKVHPVGDHWSAWDAPAAVQEGAQIHTIEPGDTLWALAERFLENAYLWPQIWERNQYIKDAHWIYPGDPLVLGFEVESAEALERSGAGAGGAAGEGAEGTADELAEDAQRDPLSIFHGEGEIAQLGTYSDIYCSGYVGRPEETYAYHIYGSEYESIGPTLGIARRGVEGRFGIVDSVKVGLDTGDIVYIDSGRNQGLMPGDLLSSVEPRELIRHPHDRKLVGRFYSYTAQVRVLSVQDETAIGEIAYSCGPLNIGAALTPFEIQPIPSERLHPLRPINEPTTVEALQGAATIVYSYANLVSLGQNQVVYLDVNAADGVEPGDIFTAYRIPVRNTPPVILGEVAVLAVNQFTSTALIIQSRHPLYVGDFLDPK